MSLSDCPKCWNTPCDCGHEYAQMRPEHRKRILDAILSVERGTYQPEAPTPPATREELAARVESMVDHDAPPPSPEVVATANALVRLRKRKLEADAAAPKDETIEYLATSPSWTCAACASTGPFKTIEHHVTGEPVEHDIECIACGSRDVRETMAEAFHAHIEVSPAQSSRSSACRPTTPRASWDYSPAQPIGRPRGIRSPRGSSTHAHGTCGRKSANRRTTKSTGR